MKDPTEAALRRKLKALERKYEQTAERSRLNGGGIAAVSSRLRLLGQQIDQAQKALDDYLKRAP